MRMTARICVATFVVAFSQSSLAKEEVVDATDPKKLVSIIQDLGYRAKLDVDNVGDPIIYSSVSGTEFSIQFFGCTDNDNCTMLLFKVGYDLEDGTDFKSMNTWNDTKLLGRAYLDDEDDPWLDWPVNMDSGVSIPNFKDTFDWWEVHVAEFESYIDL